MPLSPLKPGGPSGPGRPRNQIIETFTSYKKTVFNNNYHEYQIEIVKFQTNIRVNGICQATDHSKSILFTNQSFCDKDTVPLF